MKENIVYIELEKDIYCKLPCLVTTKDGKISRVHWCLEATLDSDGVPCVVSEDNLIGVLDNKDFGSEDTLEIFMNFEDFVLEAGFESFRLTCNRDKIYV